MAATLRALVWSAILTGWVPFAGAHPAFQGSAQEEGDPDFEEFDELDPYTEGDEAVLARLGYERFGPFPLPIGKGTPQVEEVLGGVPILWVETEHFLLGSSLRTYVPVGDAFESRALKLEMSTLARRLGVRKLPRSHDPWLRLHLYAQRLEALHASFVERLELGRFEFGADGAGLGSGPHFGMRAKPLVLLFEESASLGRFTGRFSGGEEHLMRRASHPNEGGVYVGLAAESFREKTSGLDAVLHTFAVHGVVSNFCDVFRDRWKSVPLWFSIGLAHEFARSIDPRWPVYESIDVAADPRVDHWEWRPRVRGLAQNGVASGWETMMGWRDPELLRQRDHMVAWSRVEWLLSLRGADPWKYLMSVTEPPGRDSTNDRDADRARAERNGLVAAFGAAPLDLEADWAEHVRKRYPKR